MKFGFGRQDGENFEGFSKSSLEISHYFLEDADLTFKEYRVCWSKYYYKKYE